MACRPLSWCSGPIPTAGSRSAPDSPLHREIDHAIQHEHAKSASDVLARRCRLAMVDLAEAQRLQDLVEQRLDQAGVEAVSTSPISHQLMP